jgi:hypothetical protein
MTMRKSSLHIRKYFRFLITAVFIFCGAISIYANPENKKHLAKDSSAIKSKEPSQSSQDNYYNDDYWKYEKDKPNVKQEPDVFDRLWDNFWSKVGESFFSKKDNSFNPWSILWILIFVTILVLVVLRLTNSGVSTIFSGKKKTDETETDATLEDVDIHAINYEEQIRLAISREDFRLAVRLWFLRTLKTFSDKQLVHWKIDKTNSDYYYELSGTTYQEEFGDVSKVYDYIWYGEFPVDKMSYQKAEEKFRGLNRKIE